MRDIKTPNSLFSEAKIIKKKKNGIFKFIFLSLHILILGAAGSVIAEKAIFPRLVETKFFKNFNFLKGAIERTTIINKTDQIIAPGDFLSQKIFKEGKSAILRIEIENKKSLGFVYGMAVTQDGIVFAPASEALKKSEIEKITIKNIQDEAAEAEIFEEESDNLIAVIKHSAKQLNAFVLAFADDTKVGEEVAVVSQDSAIAAFVKSVSEDKILLNDYPDPEMNGALVLNKSGEIAGMYAAKEVEGKIISYAISAKALEGKIGGMLK